MAGFNLERDGTEQSALILTLEKAGIAVGVAGIRKSLSALHSGVRQALCDQENAWLETLSVGFADSRRTTPLEITLHPAIGVSFVGENGEDRFLNPVVKGGAAADLRSIMMPLMVLPQPFAVHRDVFLQWRLGVERTARRMLYSEFRRRHGFDVADLGDAAKVETFDGAAVGNALVELRCAWASTKEELLKRLRRLPEISEWPLSQLQEAGEPHPWTMAAVRRDFKLDIHLLSGGASPAIDGMAMGFLLGLLDPAIEEYIADVTRLVLVRCWAPEALRRIQAQSGVADVDLDVPATPESLEAWREREGLSLRDAAKAVGIALSTWQRYTTGPLLDAWKRFQEGEVQDAPREWFPREVGLAALAYSLTKQPQTAGLRRGRSK